MENQVTKWLKRAKKEKRTKQITNSQKSQTKSRNQTKIIQWALASSSSSRRVAIGFRLAGGLDRLGALARLKCILVVCQFAVADAFKIYINKKCAPKMGIRHRQHIVYRVSHIVCTFNMHILFPILGAIFYSLISVFFFQTNHNESLGPYQVLIKSCRSFDSVARLMSTHTKSGGFEVVISLRFMIHKYVSLFR